MVWSFVDSHTAGEPTGLILDGAPDLNAGSVADRASDAPGTPFS